MSDKPDIILVSPPLIWGQECRMDIKPPLNLIYLGSYLQDAGYRVEILDCLAERLSLDRVLKRIRQTTARFVGAPFYQASLKTTAALCKGIKRMDAGITVIGGGPTATVCPIELLKGFDIDMAVIGEGEQTLKEVLEKDPDDIPGVAYKAPDGKIQINKKREPIADLDVLPFLDYSLIDVDEYHRFHKKMDSPPSIFLTTSRGCCYRCIYCATPQLWPGKIRRFSVERIIDEIKYHIGKYPGVNVGFMDDAFFYDRKWLEEFFAGVKDLGITYSCIGRADNLSEDVVEKLADTGCVYVALGIESGSHRMQKVIKKNLNLDRVVKKVKMLVDHGIPVKGFFMLGFPDETPEEMAETINLAVELKKAGMFRLSIFPVVVYPGTELAEVFGCSMNGVSVYKPVNPEYFNIDDVGERGLIQYSTIPNVDINSYLSGGELINLAKKAYVKVDRGEYIGVGEICKR